MTSGFSDIIEQIRLQGSGALAGVYTQYRKEFIHWLKNQFRCDTELAKDIYQQSILVFYENVQNGKLTELSSSLKTYLFSIGKNKYFEAMREQTKNETLTTLETEPIEPQHEILVQKVEMCLEQLGEPCRSVLLQYYYHKRSMEQLVEIFQYKNTDTAKNQKYKCLERLRRMVRDNVQLSIINEQ